MDKEYNSKRINPPVWQHDYHVLIRLYKIIKELCNKYLLDKSREKIIVDYGCGTSPYKKILLSFCSKYIGIDINSNGKADFVVKEDDKVPLKDGSVDAILSTQVLEHVKNPYYYLSESRRMLNNEGILILSTHGIWPYHPYPEDYHRWTKKGLQYEIERHKFKIIEHYSVLGPFAAVIQFKLLLLTERLSVRGSLARTVLAFISIAGNFLIFLSDKIVPPDKVSDASLYIICAKKTG